MSQHSRPFWGFAQGAWTRRKAAADGNEAGSVKTAWAGAKGLRDGPGTEKGSDGAKGLQPGRTHSEQLGLGRAPRKQGWSQRESAPKQDTNWCADSLAWRKGVR